MTTETKTEARERMDDKFLRALLSRMAHALPLESWTNGQRLLEEEIERARASEASLEAALSTLRAEYQRVVAELERLKAGAKP